MPFWKKLLLSRKFWAAVVGVVVPLVHEHFGLDLNEVELAGVVLTVVTYIAGLSLIEAKGGEEAHERE